MNSDQGEEKKEKLCSPSQREEKKSRSGFFFVAVFVEIEKKNYKKKDSIYFPCRLGLK